MLAVLTTSTFDPLGAVYLHCTPESGLLERRRRMSRIATLDGGAVVNDAGYSDADLTITLRWPATDAATEAAVDRLARLYGSVRVSIPDGLFDAAIEAYRPGAAQSELVLLPTARLTEI